MEIAPAMWMEDWQTMPLLQDMEDTHTGRMMTIDLMGREKS